MSNLNQNQNHTPEEKLNFYYNSMKNNPQIFNYIQAKIFDPNYVIKTEKDVFEIFELIPPLCQLFNKTNELKYYDVVVKMIEELFNSPFKSQLYLTRLLELSQNRIICEKFRYIVTKTMFTKQLEIQEKYRTQFYNTNIPNKKPFIVVLIIAHGIDLNNSLPNNENTNTLMFNLSSVPNIVSKSFNDDELETTMDKLTNIINNKPNRYIDIVNSLTEFKKTYISNVKNIPIRDELDFLAQKYSDYACRVTKPIKDKGLIFTNILNPGIYVIAGVDLNININNNNQHDNLINLLIPEDLMYFNELFGKEQDYGSNIFNNPFDEYYEEFGFPETFFNEQKGIQLSNINSYFNHLGIENVGYIDFSCRGTMGMCEVVRHKQMVLEEMGASNKCGQFPVFGGFSKGSNNKKKSKKNKSKKNKNIKNK